MASPVAKAIASIESRTDRRCDIALILGSGLPQGRIRTTISGNIFKVLRDKALRLVHYPTEPTPGLLFPCHLNPT